MKRLYQIWQHRSTGEVYSVRLLWDSLRQRAVMDGVCGPMDPLNIPRDGALSDDLYQEGRSLAELEAQRHEFRILMPPRRPGARFPRS